jgi:hypothetical protein
MQRLRAAALSAVAAVLLVPAASASAASPPRGLLVALLRLDIGCGGPRVCRPAPTPFAGAHLQIRAVDGPLRLNAVADGTGKVSLRLRSGLYLLVPRALDALAPKPVRVRVRPGQTTRVQLVFLRPRM